MFARLFLSSMPPRRVPTGKKQKAVGPRSRSRTLGAGGSRGAGWFHAPRDAAAKDRRLPAPTPQRTHGTGPRRRKTQAQALLPLRPLNPHTRTRNSLRLSQVGLRPNAIGRERRDVRARPVPRERNPKWAAGPKSRNRRCLPNMEPGSVLAPATAI